MRTLVIAPHADDEIYGMGGTMLKLRDMGHEVMSLVVCAGGDFVFEHLGKSVERDIRLKEFEAVSKAADVQCQMLKFEKDSLMDTVPLRDIVMEIEAVQDEFQAHRWYVAGMSYHQDHRAVFEAAMAAARPTRKTAPKEVFLYETVLYTWAPDCWKLKPNVYEDIGPYLDRKTELCRMYESQIRGEGPLSTDKIRQWSLACGVECGVRAAERFELIRILR